MTKYVAAVFVAFVLTAVFVLAQSASRRPTTTNTNAPAKVNGGRVKTALLVLVYWGNSGGAMASCQRRQSRARALYRLAHQRQEVRQLSRCWQAFRFYDRERRGHQQDGKRGIAGMRVGGKRQLRIPPGLGLRKPRGHRMVQSHPTQLLFSTLQLLGA